MVYVLDRNFSPLVFSTALPNEKQSNSTRDISSAPLYIKGALGVNCGDPSRYKASQNYVIF
jgi:hypothetical protein